jgi:nucleotide-binding universal stress UspA family protein
LTVLDVLTYCSDVHVWTPGVRYAAELAAGLGATLTGIHVSPPWPTREPPGAPPSLMAELLAHAQEGVHAAMEADTRFNVWAQAIGVGSVRWHVALGDPAEVLGIASNWNDVTVIDRRIGDRDDTTGLICEMLLSGVVCIAVPDNGYALTRFDRAAIVYDGSPACIRALHAAAPLLQHATNVIVIETRTSEGDCDVPERPAFDPKRYFADRGIDVEIESATGVGTRGEAILEAASRNRADLLVSGARGKRHLGECRLDEIPRHLLNYSGIPVLMAR